MQTLKTLISKVKLAVVALSILFGAVIFSTPAAYAAVSTDLHDNVCGGANLNLAPSGDDGCTQDTHANPLTNLVAKVVEILSVIVGIAAVIMIMWGGFKFITSGGDSGQVTTARNTILYALIGLVIVALAQIIVRFVLTKTPN